MPEPDIKKNPPCKPCRVGYSCGEMYSCGDVIACINKHYYHECGHDFSGPTEEGVTESGAHWGSKTCKNCGKLAIDHDMAYGP